MIEKEYDIFEVEIDFMLEEDFSELLKRSDNYKEVILNFEFNTIDKLECFYLDVIEGKEKIDISFSRLNRIMIAYIGEAIIHHAGGNWAFCKDENLASFATPVIEKWGENKKNTPISLIGFIESLNENREKGEIRNSIEYLSNKEKFENDFFKEF